MEHCKYRIASLVILSLLITLSILYDYYSLKSNNDLLIVGFKISTTSTLLLLNLIYFYMYRFNIYSVLIFITMLLNTLGDLFLGIYNPKSFNIIQHNKLFFIFGGGFFLLGRIVLTINLFLKPYKKIQIIHYPVRKFWILFTIFLGLHLCIGITFIILIRNKLSVLIFFYIIFGLTPPLVMSIMRIGELEKESRVSSILCLFGIIMYNISDIILFLTIFFHSYFPSYTHLITNDIYWLGLYLITISIVRYNSEELESMENKEFHNFYNIDSAEYTRECFIND